MPSSPAGWITPSGARASARVTPTPSAACRGVVDAKQYTIPFDEALAAVRSGENPSLSTRQKHWRECFVVAEKGADLGRIEREIKTMPNYFDEYDTVVHFISLEELRR